MRQTKNDIKYIIKRILIGVGIALILFNLKKCNVYADTTEKYVYFTGRNIYYVQNNSMDSTYLSGVGTLYFSNNKLQYNSYINENISYNFGREISRNTTDNTVWVILRYYYNNIEYALISALNPNGSFYPGLVNSDLKIMFSHYDGSIYRNDRYYLYYVPKNVTEENISSYISNNPNTSFYSFYLFTTSLNSSNVCSTTSYCSNIKSFNFDNNTYYNVFSNPSYLPADTIDINNAIILENTNNWYNLGDTTLEPDNDPLTDYTKLDLTNHFGVLLVPKDYRIMLENYSLTEEVAPGVFNTTLNLSYYSQYCTRGTLLNVENVQDILLNYTGVGTGSLSTTINGTCPEEPTETTLSYRYDLYSGMTSKAIFIYNNMLNWDSGFNIESETPYYGTSFVWYDSSLYNYYIVDSFENFNTNIDYIDYKGEQKEITIDSLPTMEQAIESALENMENNENISLNSSKLQAIFTFIKAPFTFLNKLNTESCSPINFPFPRSNQSIHIECLSSSVYDRYLPNALKTIIIIIINGLLFYRCTLSNIDIITDLLDPEDNKLEAIQL